MAANNSNVPPGRQLPSKEGSLFRQLLRFYENKQYKKGLRVAEQILKKFPEHGETTAMKGLIISFLGRKEESYELVKKALRWDISSHICWHVLGLLYRADQNYEEAIKCYKNALRNDKENLQLMRDLSVLYIQTRNYEGLKDARQMLLNVKPQQKLSWIGLALAHHLNENHEMALKVLNAYDTSQGVKDPNIYDFEQSELLLYRNKILIDAKKYEEALKDIEDIRLFVFDDMYIKETKAFLLYSLGNDGAENIYRDLLNENPENPQYYHSLIRSMKIEGDLSKQLDQFDKISEKFPKAHVPKRLALNVAQDQEFEKRFEHYIINWLRKGVPSLFVSIKPLLSDLKKKLAIEKITHQLYQSITTTKKLTQEAQVEEPTTYLWLLFFLSKLYDYNREPKKALEFIDEAIRHTPTLVDLLHQKAKIYKHAGDLMKAKEYINMARELDLQDRWINTKCTKYMIRADALQEAEDTITLFTKADSTDPANDLIDMQCMWYAIECGKSHLRRNEPGKALKRFHQIEKHFVDIAEDQFDFHSYCIRKVTLRSYVDFLQYEDRVRGHPFFFQAAAPAIQCYLDLNEKPKEQEEKKETPSTELDQLSEDEKKKALSKLKKAEAKAKEKMNENKADKNKKMNQKTDEDLNGEKFLKGNYLEEASKFLKPLLNFHSEKIETHILAIRVYLKKEKYLLALRSILKAKKIDSDHPDLHSLIIQFIISVETLETINENVRHLLNEEIELVTNFNHPESFNQKFLNSKSNSASHVLAASKSLLIISPESKQEAMKMIANIDKMENFTLEVSISAHEYARTIDNKSSEELFQKFGNVFTYSTYYHPEVLQAHTETDSQK